MKKGQGPSPKLLADLFLSFAKISLFTVGGGPAMVPLVIDLATERRGWLSKEEMLDCVMISQSLPGGVVINMATYIGKRVGGVAGMLTATFGAVFPTAALAVLVGILLGNLGENVYALGAVHGAKAAATGLVLAAFIKMGRGVLNTPLQWAVTAAAIVAVIIFHVSVIWIIVAGGVFGWVLYKVRKVKDVNAGTGGEGGGAE